LAHNPASPLRATFSGLSGEVGDDAVHARAPKMVRTTTTSAEITIIASPAFTTVESAPLGLALSELPHHGGFADFSSFDAAAGHR
jgi:hypothetical protein